MTPPRSHTLRPAVGCLHDLDRIAVHPAAQTGNLVPGPSAQVIRDRADLRIPKGRNQIPPPHQLTAPDFDHLGIEGHSGLRQLLGDGGRRHVGQ
nr:hypothetical protein [Nocardia terpenica]